jgi:hypothetical protein
MIMAAFLVAVVLILLFGVIASMRKAVRSHDLPVSQVFPSGADGGTIDGDLAVLGGDSQHHHADHGHSHDAGSHGGGHGSFDGGHGGFDGGGHH